MIVGGAAVVTAALIVAIGYLIASDVRGRAAASVSIIEARASLAETMVKAAKAVYEPTPAGFAPEILPMPSDVLATYTRAKAANEDGWRVVAMERQSDGSVKYIVVKGSEEHRAAASELKFN